MKAVVYDGQARYREDHPLPVPEPDESLVRILLAAVCNTDREVARGYRPAFSGVMGHEFVGVVEQSPDRDLVGRRVVGELNAGCGRCLYCATGRQNHCPGRKVIGMAGKDGCFAEYMTLRTDLMHPVPDSLPSEKAIYTEPLAAALEVTEQCHIPPSAETAVLGDGRLAYMTAQVLALQGIPLTVIGRHPQKLARFAPFATTLERPQGTYEVVVEATGSPSGLQTAMDLVRPRGLIVLKSTYAGTVELDMSRLVVSEVAVRGSRCGPFPPALRLLERGLVTLPELELFPLDAHEAAFSSSAFKAGFLVARA